MSKVMKTNPNRSLWSERTSLLTKCLTEPTLLEMYENKNFSGVPRQNSVRL
jgi:hypothetical protein